ncbi:MAG: hypothetical protein AAF725_14555 [Acidobacteriota bacterium]
MFASLIPSSRLTFLSSWICLWPLLILAGVPLGAQPIPATSLDLEEELMLGEPASFTVVFDNASQDVLDVGYGPFVDLVLPRNGADGDAGLATPDGLSFTGASYLGLTVDSTRLVFPEDGTLGAGTGCVEHPLARDTAGQPLAVCGTAGDELIVLELPFGSFVPDQPVLSLEIAIALSELADTDSALAIRHRSGFRFGADALDNACCDPVILSDADSDTELWPSAETRPVLFRLSKEYLGPEDETATGPNFPRVYALRLDLAAGQTVTDLDLVDRFPGTLAFLSVVETTPAGSVTDAPPVGVAAPDGGRELVVRFPEVVGVPGEADAEVKVEFFVPGLDSAGAEILSPQTGDDRISENNVSAVADWVPIDSRDPASPGNVQSDPAGPEHELSDQSIAVQKSVSLAVDQGSAGLSPGDLLEYEIALQISDFFAFTAVTLDDLLSDGQRFDPSFGVRLEVTEHGSTSSGAMDSGNFDLSPDFSPDDPAPNTGTTGLVFRISDELEERGLGGELLGGCVPAVGISGPGARCSLFDAGPTSGVLRFRTRVLEDYSDDFPSGDSSVDQNDVLANSVVASGQLLDLMTLTPNGFDEADDSAAGARLPVGELTKSIYAINGSTTLPDPLEVLPGDTVTYRLRHTLPSLDFELLTLSDYLPLPVHAARRWEWPAAGSARPRAASASARRTPSRAWPAMPPRWR